MSLISLRISLILDPNLTPILPVWISLRSEENTVLYTRVVSLSSTKNNKVHTQNLQQNNHNTSRSVITNKWQLTDTIPNNTISSLGKMIHNQQYLMKRTINTLQNTHDKSEIQNHSLLSIQPHDGNHTNTIIIGIKIHPITICSSFILNNTLTSIKCK